MRFYYRTGRRSAVSMPLWVALLGYVFIGAAIAVVVVAVAAIAVAVVLACLLVAGVAAVVGRVRRRRAS